MPVISISALLWTLLLPLPPPSQEVEDLGLAPQQLEERLTDWLNRERGLKGLTILTRDETLGEIARSHCQKMIEEKRLSHTFQGYKTLDERAKDAGLSFLIVGENIARSETFIMHHIHKALMNSPNHQRNMLLPTYSHVGVGIEKSDLGYFVCQIFAKIVPSQNTDQKEKSQNKRDRYKRTIQTLFSSKRVLFDNNTKKSKSSSEK